jgi:hypothetical protein
MCLAVPALAAPAAAVLCLLCLLSVLCCAPGRTRAVMIEKVLPTSG